MSQLRNDNDPINKFVRMLSWGMVQQLKNCRGSHEAVMRTLDKRMPWFRPHYHSATGKELTNIGFKNIVATLKERYVTWPECERVPPEWRDILVKFLSYDRYVTGQEIAEAINMWPKRTHTCKCFGRDHKWIKKCPRCGVGDDTNGDGDCLACHDKKEVTKAPLRCENCTVVHYEDDVPRKGVSVPPVKNSRWTAYKVAEFLGISISTVYKETRKGLIPAHQIGRRVVYDPEEVEEYYRQSKIKIPSIYDHANHRTFVAECDKCQDQLTTQIDIEEQLALTLGPVEE